MTTNFKGKRILSFVVMLAVLTTMITFTLPVSAEGAGTVLWSEDFDGLESSPWGVTLWGAQDNDTYKNANSVAVDGRLVVTKNQLAGTSINTDYVRFTAPMASSGEFATPDSGYLAFDFDYEQSANWVGSNPYSNMLLLNAAGANIAGFGFGGTTNGLRIIAGTDDQFTVPAQNVAPASVFVGQTVSVRLLFDLEQDTYQVFYTPEGGEKVKAFDPVAIPSVSEGTLADGGFDLSNIRFTIACINETENNGEPVTMTFDNFLLTAFDENPEVEPVIPTVVSTTIAETGMGLTESIKVLFNTPMSFDTLSGVTLHKGSAEGPTVALTPAISTDKLATYFSHAPLDYNTTYVLKVPNTVKSTTNGAFEGDSFEFTTISRTEQHNNVLWFEDFDTRVDWDVMESRAGWGMLLHEYINGEDVGMSGYSNMGDRDNKNRSKVEFREGGLMFTRPQDYEGSLGNNYAHLTVPFTGYSISDTADYVAVEFDYYQSDSFNSKYSGDVRILNSNSQVVFGSNFGSAYYGFQYKTYDSLNPSNYTAYPDFYNLLKSYTPNDDTVNSHELPRGDISNVESHWVGNKIDVQVLFDIQNRKYIVNYVSDGTRYTAGSGWQDIIPDVNFDLSKITLTSACDSATGKPVVTTKFDNVAIVEYNAPHVAQTSVDAMSNIETDEPVTITFTEPMMEDTLEGITLKKGSVAVTIDNIELSADGKTVTLICDELDNGAAYTLTVPETVMSQYYFAVEEQYTKTFTTMAANAAPEVKEISFTDGATEVELDKEISVTFNKPMNEESLANVTLTGDGQRSVALDVSMSNGNKTATFGHADLNYQTVYTLTVPTTVKSQDGVFIVTEKTYTFTTETAPTPPVVMSASVTDGETGVPVTSEFSFTFDKAMDTSTFEDITLMQGQTNIPLYLTVSNGNKTVKLGHPKLENGTQYTLTIPTSVKSVIGLGVTTEQVYTFTTANVVEGETLLYGQYFDTAIGGATETQAQYQDGNWNIYSRVENQTAFSDTNKVEFKDGKMVITKEQRIPDSVSTAVTKYPESENAIYAVLDLSTAASMPETGVVAIEYDINYSKRPQATMWYTDTTVSTNTNGNSAYEITRLSFSSGSFGWNDKSVTNDVNSGTVITPNTWLQGKDIHVKLVYNLDERTYSMFYTVDGVTYQSPVGVAPFRAQITSTKIAKLAFSYVYRYYDDDPITITLDNVEVKKLTKPVVDTDVSSVVDGQSGVSATERIKIAFNSDMNTNYFKDIKIYEGEVAPENIVPTTSVFEDSKTCYIYLDKGLKYSTQYVIDVPSSVVSTNLIPVATTDISFTTEAPAVGYGVEFISVKNASDITVTDIRGLTSVKAEIKFTNEMCAYLNAPKLVVALCDSEGNIKSISYRETPVFVGSPQTVTVSFESVTPFGLGDCLKAYVLDGTTGSLMSQEVIYNQ